MSRKSNMEKWKEIWRGQEIGPEMYSEIQWSLTRLLEDKLGEKDIEVHSFRDFCTETVGINSKVDYF